LTSALNLKTRYQSISNDELIGIIESPEGDYTDEAIDIARNESRNRGLSEEELRSIARQMLTERMRTYLDGFNVINDKLKLPKSRILNTEEVKALFTTVFTQWKHENDDMIPDGWQYVLAAGFG
jgi:hypothetical protein